MIASGLKDAVAMPWNPMTGSLQCIIACSGAALSVASSLNSKVLALGPHYGRDRLWNAVTGSLERKLEVWGSNHGVELNSNVIALGREKLMILDDLVSGDL
ncbi:hypothetical protein CC78DRAFT_111441 [Lojkania enalia]|uniref:Uncharacterized protein n=1 Tax=Lojkania enalia TaxID=147567 RepID=A0A9P4KIE1_9PLEO|nr:hypothetical protein CC78DRAFT_111441 [Didymosphaeria enalia]